MPDQIVTTTTSKKFSLQLNDWTKGLLMAVGSPVIAIIIDSLNKGSLQFNWTLILTVGLSAGLMYISKNFFTPAVTKISMPEGQVAAAGKSITVSIPKPGETIKAEVPKVLIFILCMGIAMSSGAQSFFKPLPKPTQTAKLGAAATPLIQNSFRPLVGVTALFSDGTSLAGGVGAGLMHNKWDEASQSWVTQYSVSGLAFLDTQGSILAGLGFGFLNLFNVGPVYNFGTKKFGIITGITIKPF